MAPVKMLNRVCGRFSRVVLPISASVLFWFNSNAEESSDTTSLSEADTVNMTQDVIEDSVPAEKKFSSQVKALSYVGFDMAVPRSASFIKNSLDTAPDFQNAESWLEAQMSFRLKHQCESGRELSAQVFFSPLFGLGKSIKRDASEQIGGVQEVYACLRSVSNFDWGITAGKRAIEPNAGLYAHPTYLLPIVNWNYSPVQKQTEIQNAVMAEISGTLPESIMLTMRWFPALTASPHEERFINSQDQAANIEASITIAQDHSLKLSWYKGPFTSYGFSWEWVKGWIQFFTEGSIRNQKRMAEMTNIPMTFSGFLPFVLMDRSDKYWPLISMGSQVDFQAGFLKQMRMSLEYIYSGEGWRADITRNFDKMLNQMDKIEISSPSYLEKMNLLGNVAQTWSFEDAYRDRLMLRFNSIESFDWGWSVNLIGLGPFDGLLCSATGNFSFLNVFEFSASLESLVASRDNALIGQLPQHYRFWSGISFHFSRRN
jgi:hypothetical protein